MATFNIFFDPLHQPTALQRLDILQAAQVWSGVIQDNLVFDIQVGAHALGGAHNAMCIPGIVQDAGRTLTRAQAKLLGVAIVDIAVPAFDMVILIDNATHWVTGFAPVPHVGPAQFSLMTTVMHEICHGLGMLALCGVDNAAQTGTYSDTALIAGLPQGVAPASFFPAGLVAGYQWLTPFSALFAYQGVLAILTKGVAADDYAAFLSAPGPVVIPGVNYTVLTGAPFVPFTTCDHIDGDDPNTHAPYLMSNSTVGLFMAAPDTAATDILRAMGWNC